MCVGSWAFIDRRLYQIFHHSVRLAENQSALFYYRNRAFNQRLRLVDDAVKMALSKEQFDDEWKPLRNQVETLSHTRNSFAHQPAMRLGTAKDGEPFDIYSIYIEPYERVLNNDYPGLRGKTELTVDDLIQHDFEIGQLEISLHDFARRMGRWVVEQNSAEGGA